MTEHYITAFFLIVTFGFLGWFWFSPRFGALRMKKRAGGALQVDTRFFYSPETMYRLFDQYGADGRRDFRIMLLVDMVFPVIYALTLCLLADVLVGYGFYSPALARFSMVMAIMAAAFDYVENIALLLVLKIFPEKCMKTAYIACYATSFKMVATHLAVLSLIGGVGATLFL